MVYLSANTSPYHRPDCLLLVVWFKAYCEGQILEVRLLGQFDVRLDGNPVEIHSRPAQSLLAYLLLNAGAALRRVFQEDSSKSFRCILVSAGDPRNILMPGAEVTLRAVKVVQTTDLQLQQTQMQKFLAG
jgi:hypothetical protein